MRHGFRRVTGLAEQLGQQRVGLRYVWKRIDRGARRRESLIEGVGSFQSARLGYRGPERPGGSRGGAERGNRFDALPPRMIKFAETELGCGKIRLQPYRRPIARDRLVLLALTIENVSEAIVRGRDAEVETQRGGERVGRLFQPAGGEHGDAQLMVGGRCLGIELDRPLEQGDGRRKASLTRQTRALAGQPLGFVRARGRRRRRFRRARGGSLDVRASREN
jgi:hypothetical protein